RDWARDRSQYQSAAQGAVPTLYAATAEQAQPGHYYGPTGDDERSGPLGLASVPAAARDTAAAARLWTVTERLAGVSVPSAAPMTASRAIAAVIRAEPDEVGASLTGFAVFFCIFAGYFMLRPVREAMGIAAGVDRLQWLFTATFAATVLVVPLFAWLSSRVPRRAFAGWVYAAFCANLVAFALAFHAWDGNLWIARAFYVWVSVYNLFVVSVTWSVMADVFDAYQARRLFAFVAAGASVGGLVGPAAGALLVGTIGHPGLVLVAAVLLGVALAARRPLMRWRERGGAGRPGAPPAQNPRQPVAGNPFSGMARVLRSPYLLAISGFV